MARIQDIGAFSSVREAGLAKLLPSVPRIAIGMGTCGRGNGAEGLFHAFAEHIHTRGINVVLAPVGCFGACFQEPMLNVRLPGGPLLMLRSAQADDAAHILQEIANGKISQNLVVCKIEEWDHITGKLKYGQDYPEIPSWDQTPFFRKQKKIVLRIAGSSTRMTLRSTSPSAAIRLCIRC